MTNNSFVAELRLNLKIVRFPSHDPGFASRVGRSGIFFFILVKVSLVLRALPLFDIRLVVRKRTFIIGSDRALVNQRNKGIRFN